MTHDREGLPERIGRTINELDIDFSRLTPAGWTVAALSLAAGGLLGYVVYGATVGRIADDRGPALATGLTMIFVTVGVFLALRGVSSRMGFRVTRIKNDRDQP